MSKNTWDKNRQEGKMYAMTATTKSLNQWMQFF